MSNPGPSGVRRQGSAPLALLLAGPNGAGKTTAQALLLPPEVVFLNADVEAARLIFEGHPSEGIDIAAGRAVLTRLKQLVAIRTPFCLETNLAGRGLVHLMRSWQSEGFVVRLYFVALRNPELALARVAERVAAGGHNVPDVTVRRRWQAGLQSLFEIYVPLVDAWSLADNSGPDLIEVARGEHAEVEVVEHELWEHYRKASGLSP